MFRKDIICVVTVILMNVVFADYALNIGSYVPVSVDIYYAVYAFGVILVGYLLRSAYRFFFELLNYSRSAGKIQFPEVNKILNADGAGLLHMSRRLGDFPPPYPNGWFVLCHSSDLAKGDVRPMNVLGGQYVLWRDMSGAAHLFDSYCPHMGANLAFGGVVKDNCLRCPFHGWHYDGEGNCKKIPYASKPSEYVKAKSFTIMEQDQLIYFWHDAEGRTPFWFPPEHKEIAEGKFTFHGRTEHQVFAHLQELPENGADVPHLSALHTSVQWPIIHHWEGSWEALGSKEKFEDCTNVRQTSIQTPVDTSKLPHWTQITLFEKISVFGIPIKYLDVTVNINQIGPGIVWMRFITPFGEALVCGAATPFAPMIQRTYHFIYSSRTVPRWMAKQMVYTLGQFYEQDVMIWQWKTFPAKPSLVKEDGNIRKFRKWFSQFYSEHSIPFNDAVQEYNKGRSAVPVEW